MASYFVDLDDGSDAAAGTSAATAWLTLGKAFGAAGISDTTVTNTIYIKPGVYREVNTLAMTNPTAVQTFIGDVHGEQSWTTAPTTSDVVLTNYLTDDQTAATGSSMIDMAQRDYITLRRLIFINGSQTVDRESVRAANSGSSDSRNINIDQCAFLDGGTLVSGNTGALYIGQGSLGEAMAWKVSRCEFQGCNHAIKVQHDDHASALTHADIEIVNCIFHVGENNGGVYVLGQSGTYLGGGVVVHACSFFAGGGVPFGAVDCTDSNLSTSTTNPLELLGNIIRVFGNAGYAAAATNSGQIVADFNFVTCGNYYQNITPGSNDVDSQAAGDSAAVLDYGRHHATTGLSNVSWFMPVEGSNAIGLGAVSGYSSGAYSWPDEDFFGRPRPGSGDANGAVGAVERWNMMEQSSANPRDSGGQHWRSTGPQVQDFELAVDDTSTTISVYVYRTTASYTLGTRPMLHVLNGETVGVADATDTGTASCDDAWEELTLTFTPTSKGAVTIRWENASAATAGVADWDDWSVT